MASRPIDVELVERAIVALRDAVGEIQGEWGDFAGLMQDDAADELQAWLDEDERG